jgi:hypothetical protein
MGDRTIVDVDIVIAESTTVSREANVNQRRIVGVILPVAWTGAGDLTLSALVGQPAGNPPAPAFGSIVDDAGVASGKIGTAVAAGIYIALPAAKQFVGLGRIKITATVAQAADRRIRLVTVDV